MQVYESLLVSRYRNILKHNKKTPEQINALVKEYIDYIEGINTENLSDELVSFLTYLETNLHLEQEGKEKRR